MSDDVYSLLSDLMALPGRYSPQTLSAAKQHIRETMRGGERDALIQILVTLESLVRNRQSKYGSVAHAGSSRGDVELNEVAAILSDQEFLPSRSSLIELLQVVLKDQAPRVSSKDSREQVIRKAILAFSALEPGKRVLAFRSLRSRFIRARGSSLKDWSDIIRE